MNNLKDKLIKHIKREGIELRTDTKARGNLGFYRENRIDIHKKLPDDKFIEVLLHEYAHVIHKRIEPDMAKTGGTLKTIFGNDCTEVIQEELKQVTYLVDENALSEKLDAMKYAYKIKIKAYENLIKKEYPEFLKSKPFKQFEKYIRHSDARFLLKYDKVRILTPFLKREKYYSIGTIEKDFPRMPISFVYYIKIVSLTRKSKNIQKRKNKLKKYYERPSELFARFIQAFYKFENDIKELAPTTYTIFQKKLCEEDFKGLSKIIAILHENSL